MTRAASPAATTPFASARGRASPRRKVAASPNRQAPCTRSRLSCDKGFLPSTFVYLLLLSVLSGLLCIALFFALSSPPAAELAPASASVTSSAAASTAPSVFPSPQRPPFSFSPRSLGASDAHASPRFFSFVRASLKTFPHSTTPAPSAGRGLPPRPLAAGLPPFTQALLPSPFQPSLETLVPQVSGAASASLSAAARACLKTHEGASVLLETSGLYEASYIREFDFCSGRTLRQLYLHPSLFAEGAAYLWDTARRRLLLLVITWLENRMLVLDALTWAEVAQLQIPFEGWGLASSLSAADAALAATHLSPQGAPTTPFRPPAPRFPGASQADPLGGLEIRLQRQRLWATTGGDVLLELDVPSLLAAVSQGEAAVNRRPQRHAGTVNAALETPAETAAEKAAAETEAEADGLPLESRQANWMLRLASLFVGGTTVGVSQFTEKAEDLATIVEAEKTKKKDVQVSAVSAAPFALTVASALPAVAELPLVKIRSQTPIRCLGRALPRVNELEFLPERGSLVGNIFGEAVLAELDVQTGACIALFSFGGIGGLLQVNSLAPTGEGGDSNSKQRESGSLGAQKEPEKRDTRSRCGDRQPRDSAAAPREGATKAKVGKNVTLGKTPRRRAVEMTLNQLVCVGRSFLSQARRYPEHSESLLFGAQASRRLAGGVSLLSGVTSFAYIASFSRFSRLFILRLWSLLQSADRSNRVMNGVSLLPSLSSGAAAEVAPPVSSAAAPRKPRRLAASSAPVGYPSSLVVTGKQWKELHVAELLELHPPRALRSYLEVNQVFPGFFSFDGLARI
ncbi:hypothetical protein BESB_084050 [Besnoitia besnoiti]|uniref:Transmembrane protein n=1 Tax=Besnoitia besnoiti TaxID=94643 RepID=A0A2A9MBA3_BESBE|nr:hypothetical protein BESB_084050 [Besnoitia besnoiti]PFH33206.1 hypothetical protein BESB_084050 [Besnoitia besnoiti]